MKNTTKSPFWQVLVWILWLLLLLNPAWGSGLPEGEDAISAFEHTPLPAPLDAGHPLAGTVVGQPRLRLLFPWLPRFRWRKWAVIRYQAWKRRQRQARWAHRRAVCLARLARLALSGAISFATVVDLLTQTQLRYKLGALPLLYGVLEILGVRQIINRYCPQGRAEIDYGTVALVLILNRLLAPCALHNVADWFAQTVLVAMLGVPADKFNDDRLARTLDALTPHLREIWLQVICRAINHFDIDLSVIFHDLTAFVVHGEYEKSKLADFGFAHNTPMGKRKFKLGLNTIQDGNIPMDYASYSGRTADTAAVEPNLERLLSLLANHGYPIQGITLVGDRANLNDELALFYDHKQQETGVTYLAGLEARKKEHKLLLTHYPDSYFYRHPLRQRGYYGLPCEVVFEHEGKKVTHRGLIVLSKPMLRARRRGRIKQFRALQRELKEVASRIGQPYYRTVEAVQARADTRLRNSPVGKLMQAWAYEEKGQIRLRWQIDRQALNTARRRDGRYLLVTNHPTLAPSQMLQLYRNKDGGEKRFMVCKKDFRLSPIRVHKDNRIEALLLLQMLALLVYSVLERQSRQHGLALTTRRMIAILENLTVIETRCWDSSVLVRLAPVNEEQSQLLQALAEILDQMRWPRLKPTLLPASSDWLPQGLSPGPPMLATANLLPLPTS